MSRTRSLAGGLFALNFATLLGSSGCGTNPVTYPDNVIYGKWSGKLLLTGSLKVGMDMETIDPKEVAFTIIFDDQGIPATVQSVGSNPSNQPGGFDIHDLLTPGQMRQGSFSSTDTTGTATLTCIEADFKEASMRYVFKLELDLMVTNNNVQYPSTSTTTTTIEASVTGQTCHYVTDTVTDGSAPVESPSNSGMIETKDFNATAHGEGDLSRS